MRSRWDAVILGAGTAGMACAVTAAEHGAQVCVVEKTGEVGGTLHLSSGELSAAGTARQRSWGVDDDPERHWQDVVRISRGTADPIVGRLAVDAAPRTVAWLEELGVELGPDTPVINKRHEPYATARVYSPPGAGRDILRALARPWNDHLAAGRIDLLEDTRVDELVRDGDGGVSGVRAVRVDGRRVVLRGAHVVLATGGYGANLAMLRARAPGTDGLVSACRPSSTGDGVRLAEAVGAAFHRAERQLPALAALAIAPAEGMLPRFITLNPHVWPPRAIHVNVRGERFLAEDDLSNDRRERALLAQPGQRMWVVFDEASLADGTTFDPNIDATELRALACEGACAWAAADLDALAQLGGVDPAGLARTVDAWNAAVTSGVDPLGVRQPGPPIATPPFFAVAVTGAVVTTFGGLAVDGDLRVLDHAGCPVPGLFAAGEVIGTGTTSGSVFSGGMSATAALSFGRLVGLTVAAGSA